MRSLSKGGKVCRRGVQVLVPRALPAHLADLQLQSRVYPAFGNTLDLYLRVIVERSIIVYR